MANYTLSQHVCLPPGSLLVKKGRYKMCFQKWHSAPMKGPSPWFAPLPQPSQMPTLSRPQVGQLLQHHGQRPPPMPSVHCHLIQVPERLHFGVLFVVHWQPPSCDLRTLLWALVMSPVWVSSTGEKEKGPCLGEALCLPGGGYVHSRQPGDPREGFFN